MGKVTNGPPRDPGLTQTPLSPLAHLSTQTVRCVCPPAAGQPPPVGAVTPNRWPMAEVISIIEVALDCMIVSLKHPGGVNGIKNLTKYCFNAMPAPAREEPKNPPLIMVRGNGGLLDRLPLPATSQGFPGCLSLHEVGKRAPGYRVAVH